MPLDEHRRFARITFSAPATLTLAASTCEGDLLDLSFKGALIRLRTPLLLGRDENCTLELPLGESDERIRMAGRVAHVEDRRIGIVCQSIDVDSLTHLRRLIELNSLDHALFERDLTTLIADAARK
jgi:hypothetical protein